MDEIVEAVKNAIAESDDLLNESGHGYWEGKARAAYAAARPLIEREVLEDMYFLAEKESDLPQSGISHFIYEYAKSRNITLGE